MGFDDTRPTIVVGVHGTTAGGIHHLAHAAMLTLEEESSKQSHHPSTNNAKEYVETFHTTQVRVQLSHLN
jgi:hypothetical protein